MRTRFVKKHWFHLCLCLVLLVIFAKNYTGGTYLLGWDSLAPELNLGINIKRSLFSAWQEYQGLGLVAGMGHAADLVRQILILPLVLIFPDSLVRYIFHFGMMALGSWGLFVFLRKEFKFKPLLSLVGALFYLLNFSSVQNFYVAFEPFSTFWGFFPWLVYFLLNYLKKPSKKGLGKLLAVNILASPAFYVQTNFVVYVFSILALVIPQIVPDWVSKKVKIDKYLKAGAVVLVSNAFWLLPFLYFLVSGNVQNTTEGFANIMASEETFMRNQYRGSWGDFLLLRGFYFDFRNASSALMAPWVAHFQNDYILLVGYALGLLALGGIVFSKVRWLWLILLTGMVALLSATPPFSWINEALRASPFLNQVFRSPFTKFVTPISFVFSIGVVFGLKTLIGLVKNLGYKTKTASLFFPVLVVILLFVYSAPVWGGNYFYSKVRVNLPSEYPELIKFFKTQPKTGRIMNLPQGSFWGWVFYNWDYTGSGFWWYGIEQPILDRTFDVWSLENEKYYWQLNEALQKRDLELLNQVIEQYDIEYIIFDNSVYYPGERDYALQVLKTERMLNVFTKIAEFGEIKVYKTGRETRPYLTGEKDNFLMDMEYEEKEGWVDPNLVGVDPVFCGENREKMSIKKTEDGLYLTSLNDPGCLNWHYPNLDLTRPYILEVIYRNISGHSLTVAAFNRNNKYFFRKLSSQKEWVKEEIPVSAYLTVQDGAGLTIQIRNPSFNQYLTENEIKSIKLFLTEEKERTKPPKQDKKYLDTKSNIFWYKVEIKEPGQSDFLVVPQSYDRGWVAVSGGKMLPHVRVNNWANGWEVEEGLAGKTVYIIFWPQILEFLGFGMLGVGAWWILKRKD